MSSSEFCCSSGLQSENKIKLNDEQISGPCQRIKKAMKREGDDDTNYD